MAETKMITLQSSDEKNFVVDLKVAHIMTTVKNMLEDIVDDSSLVFVPNVTGEILKMVIEYCGHHSNDIPTDDLAIDGNQKSRSKGPKISAWDEQFCSVDKSVLFGLIQAANFLDIKSLLDLTTLAVANLIMKCANPEQIRAEFNIKNDFTPQEEEQIRKENAWCDDFDV